MTQGEEFISIVEHYIITREMTDKEYTKLTRYITWLLVNRWKKNKWWEDTLNQFLLELDNIKYDFWLEYSQKKTYLEYYILVSFSRVAKVSLYTIDFPVYMVSRNDKYKEIMDSYIVTWDKRYIQDEENFIETYHDTIEDRLIIHKFWKKLNKKEKQLCNLRFWQWLSRENVGKIMWVSRETIRTMEIKVKEKLALVN